MVVKAVFTRIKNFSVISAELLQFFHVMEFRISEAVSCWALCCEWKVDFYDFSAFFPTLFQGCDRLKRKKAAVNK